MPQPSPHTSPTSAPPSQDRWVLLDALRVPAILEVIHFHLSGEKLIAGLGMPIFLMMSIVFASRGAARRTFREYAAARSARMLPPFLFWSVVYAVLRTALRWIRGDPLFDWFTPWVFINGAAVHLWFVPFILLANIAVVRTAQILRDRALPLQIWTAFALGVAFSWPAWLDRLFPSEMNQWAFAVPSLFFGFAIGRAARAAKIFPARRVHLLLLAGVSLVIAVVTYHAWDRNVLERYTAAVALMNLIILLPQPATRATEWLVNQLAGVYLVHMIFVAAADILELTERSPVLATALIFVLSLLTVAMLRKIPFLRHVV